ncbi:MAG: hypothetical protein ABL867_03050 [Rickettsiales bacterium]
MKNLITIILLLISSTAHAEEIDPKFFKSWLTLSDLLQSKGIIPSAPSWAAILPMCLPLKKSEDETDYNRCLYEKTMDEFQWPVDYKYCKTQAEIEYNREYTSYVEQQNQRMPQKVTITEKNGTTRVIEYPALPVTPLHFNPPKDKINYFQDCMMQEKLWNNSERWAMGRRKPEKEVIMPKQATP